MLKTVLLQLKVQITILLVSAFVFYTPIKHFLIASFILYLVNVLIAIVHDKKDGGDPNIKKFFISLKEYGIYIGAMLIVYLIAFLFKEVEFGLFVAKYMTLAISYFYVQNSIKNLKKIAPDSKFVWVLDFFVNGRFLTDKFPLIGEIKEWLKKENKE